MENIKKDSYPGQNFQSQKMCGKTFLGMDLIWTGFAWTV